MIPKVKRVYSRAWVMASNRSHFIVTPVYNGKRYFLPNRISRSFASCNSRYRRF